MTSKLHPQSILLFRHAKEGEDNVEKEWWNLITVRCGYSGDFIFDKKMKVKTPADSITVDLGSRTDQEVLQPKGRVYKTYLQTEGGQLVVSLLNCVELQWGKGVTSFRIETFGNTFGTPTQKIPVTNMPRNSSLTILSSSGSTHFFSGKFILRLSESFAIGASGGRLVAKPRLHRVILDNTAPDYDHTNAWLTSSYDLSSVPRAILTVYQAALSVSWWLPISTRNRSGFSPYCSLLWNRTKLDFHSALLTHPVPSRFHNVLLADLQESLSMGFCLGMTCCVDACVSLTCEGRWFDEKAVYVETQVRF